jgi:hypothetical protein
MIHTIICQSVYWKRKQNAVMPMSPSLSHRVHRSHANCQRQLSAAFEAQWLLQSHFNGMFRRGRQCQEIGLRCQPGVGFTIIYLMSSQLTSAFAPARPQFHTQPNALTRSTDRWLPFFPCGCAQCVPGSAASFGHPPTR